MKLGKGTFGEAFATHERVEGFFSGPSRGEESGESPVDSGSSQVCCFPVSGTPAAVVQQLSLTL